MNTNGRTKTSDGKRATVTGTEKVRATAFTGVTMPVANYYDNLWWSETSHTAADAKVTTTLTVYAEKTSKNVAKFRIDKIRFVPVN